MYPFNNLAQIKRTSTPDRALKVPQLWKVIMFPSEIEWEKIQWKDKKSVNIGWSTFLPIIILMERHNMLKG